MTGKVPCTECGVLILPATAMENGGQCMPCANGTRESIEEGKRYAAERSSRDQDPFWLAWTDISARRHANGFSSLSKVEQDFYAMNLLRGSVLRGGFHPYFDMAAPEEIETAKRAFRELGAPEISLILERAEEILFPDGMPSDVNAQKERLPSWTEQEIENDSEPEWSVTLGEVNESFYVLATEADVVVQKFFESNF